MRHLRMSIFYAFEQGGEEVSEHAQKEWSRKQQIRKRGKHDRAKEEG